MARFSRAANPAPAMLPPIARTVRLVPTEMPVDAGSARSVTTTAMALATRPIPRLMTQFAVTACQSASCQTANPVYPANMAAQPA